MVVGKPLLERVARAVWEHEPWPPLSQRSPRKLIERLLADPAFRDRFRRNPARACREAGLESLAEEMQLGAGKAMHTLDIRESRSSLAGVMMAAAMEGMGIYEFSQARRAAPRGPVRRGRRRAEPGEPAGAAGRGRARGRAGGERGARTAPPGDGRGGGRRARRQRRGRPRRRRRRRRPSRGEGGGAAPEAAAAKPSRRDGRRSTPPGTRSPARRRRRPQAEGRSSAAARRGGAGRRPSSRASATGAPAGAPTRTPVDERGRLRAADRRTSSRRPSEGGPEPGAEQPAPPAAAAGAGAASPEPQAPSEPVDASAARPGRHAAASANAEALALLENKNVVLDDVGVADIKAGKIDPRIVGVLTKLSQEHKIVVSCMCSDHSKFTAGGSISNHAFGRGLDIASIDGEIVSPGSALAREVASELSELDPAIRPDEIGSPFAINGPGYFTDAAHSEPHPRRLQDRDHARLQAARRARRRRRAAAPRRSPRRPRGARAAPAAPRLPRGGARSPPAAPKRASGLFAAAGAGQVARPAPSRRRPAATRKLFLQAVERRAAAAQPAAAAAAPAVEPAARSTSPGVPGEYPGDDAPKEQIAAWMAAEAKKRGLPAQLPVMAALVESNLTNVNFGDADSLGYFQMRVSFWDSGDYAGFADDPKKQVDWFLDTAERVKAQRVSRGQSITDPDQFGEWIADVERPAEQYRGRYQLQLDEANGLLAERRPRHPPPPKPRPPHPPHPSRRAGARGAGGADRSRPVRPGRDWRQAGRRGAGAAAEQERRARRRRRRRHQGGQDRPADRRAC